MPFTSAAALQPTGNVLLDRLSAADFAALSPYLSRAALPRGAALTGPEAVANSVYFPTSGLVSMVHTMVSGDTAEIAVVGREGLVGWPGLAASEANSIAILVLLPLTAITANLQALRRFAEANPEFHQSLSRTAELLFLQAAQTAGCNRHHTVAARLAKWLLLASDRSDVSSLSLTHENLSMLLGARRAGVTESLSTLKAAGALALDKGRISILDRAKLEQYSCECYAMTKAKFD